MLVAPVIPTLVLLPILFCILTLLGNPALYYGVEECGGGAGWGLVSPLVPRPGASILYILLNIALNTGLHAALWGAMLATSPTVLILVWPRLERIIPALVVLASLAALASLPYWFLSVKPVRGTAGRRNSKSVYVVSTSL